MGDYGGGWSVFVRDWWRDAEPGEWSGEDGLVPYPGAPVSVLLEGIANEREARDLAQAYNAAHEPGRYSRKAEYTSGRASVIYSDRLVGGQEDDD